MSTSEEGIYAQIAGIFASLGYINDKNEGLTVSVNVGVQGSVVVAGYASSGFTVSLNLDNPSFSPFSDDFVFRFNKQANIGIGVGSISGLGPVAVTVMNSPIDGSVTGTMALG